MLSHKLLNKKKKLYKVIFQPSNMNYFHTVVKKDILLMHLYELTCLHYCSIT